MAEIRQLSFWWNSLILIGRHCSNKKVVREGEDLGCRWSILSIIYRLFFISLKFYYLLISNFFIIVITMDCVATSWAQKGLISERGESCTIALFFVSLYPRVPPPRPREPNSNLIKNATNLIRQWASFQIRPGLFFVHFWKNSRPK